MKTIIFLLTLVLAGSIISSSKNSTQINKSEKAGQDSQATKKSPDDGPIILFLLSKDKGKSGLPASLWWANTGKPGC